MKKPVNYKENSRIRISELIEEFCGSENDRKQQAFADMCGVSKYSISQYVNGSNAPGNISAAKIAGKCNVNPLWVMGFDVPRVSDPDRFRDFADAFNSAHPELPNPGEKPYRIPVLGRVAAGIPINAIEEIIDWEELPSHMAKQGNLFGLKVRGNSMEPGINNGDVVIVREQEDAEDGQIVIALVNGNDGVCKRLKRYDNGTIALFSDNVAYQPMYFNNVEQDDIPVRIIGVVKELRRKF